MRTSIVAMTLLVALGMSGCAQRASNPQSRASAAQVAACRRSADQAVLQQHPETVYQSDAYVSGTLSAPFSGQGLSSNITGGLPERYTRQEYYDNCLNGIGPAPQPFSPSPGAPAPPPPVMVPPPS
jgi:hypothetical protein